MPENASSNVDAFLNEHWIPGVVDQIGDISALLKVLMRSNGLTTMDAQKPGLSKMITGGNVDNGIKRTIRYSRATARGSFRGYSLLRSTPTDQFDFALFSWASYYSSIPISFDEEMAARGVEQVLPYVGSRIRAATSDLLDLIGTGLYNDAAAITSNWADNQGYGLHGLRELCAANRLWGGITSSATLAWWNAGHTDTTTYTEANMMDPTHANYILSLLRTGINNCRAAGREPTHIMVSPYIFDLVEDTVITNKIGGMNVQKADIGYKFISYRGIELVREETTYLPDNFHAFYLRIEGGADAALRFVGREGAWFFLTEKHPSFNQMSNVRYLVAQGALVADEPRLFGMNTGLGS